MVSVNQRANGINTANQVESYIRALFIKYFTISQFCSAHKHVNSETVALRMSAQRIRESNAIILPSMISMDVFCD